MPPISLINQFTDGGAGAGSSGLFSGSAGPGLGSLGTPALSTTMIDLGRNTGPTIPIPHWDNHCWPASVHH
jgi:hypothetical protein